MRSVTQVPAAEMTNVDTTMKKVVRGGVDDVPRLDDLGRFLGQAGEQRVDGAEQQVGAVAAGDAGERRGQAGYGWRPAPRKMIPPSGTSST